MAASWSSANKFRLCVIVGLSLLTSAAAVDIATAKLPDLFYPVIQAAIAGFAYLQCPGDRPGQSARGGTPADDSS